MIDLYSEEAVLGYALQGNEQFSEALQVVKPDFFQDARFLEIWKLASEYYYQYSGVIDPKGLEDGLQKSERADSARDGIISAFLRLKSNPTERDSFLSSLDKLKRISQWQKLYQIEEIIRVGLHKDSADLDELSRSIIDKILDTSSESGFTGQVSFPQTLEERQRLYMDRRDHPEKYIGVPFGIRPLDELFGGGYPQELGLIFGRSSVGKSRTLASIGYNMCMAGYNVLYVTIEMPLHQMGRLFDSRHFMISSTGLKKGSLTTEDETRYFDVARRSRLETTRGDFYVIDAPDGCTVNSLIPLIRRYKTRKPVQVVIVDYLNLMKDTSRRAESNESLRLGKLARDLKGLARLENLFVLTASQANRKAVDGKQDVGHQHVAWSDQIPYHCDIMIYLEKENPTDAIIKGTSLKHRDGMNSKFELGVLWDYSYVTDIERYLEISGQRLPDNPPSNEQATDTEPA